MAVFRLGVYAIAAYDPGATVSIPFDDDSLRWLFDPDQPGSVARFWSDATHGQIRIQATVHPWIAAGSTAIKEQLASRNGSAAMQLFADHGYAMDPYDGYCFMIGPGPVDAGTCYIPRGDRIVAVAYFDPRGEHGFLCHEIGHVLGYQHPFDLSIPDPLNYPTGEYGDPTCVMSAKNFGGRPVTFTFPESERGPFATREPVWTLAGPSASAATLWRWSPGFPAAPDWAVELPRGASTTTVRLARPGTAGTRLVILPTSGASRWHTLEFRPAKAWDRAFGPAGSAGLVVHEIRDVGTAAVGPGWPRKDQACYVDTFPLPPSGDLDWSNGQLSFEVVQTAVDWVEVRVGALPARGRFVTLTTEESEDVVSVTDGPPIQVSKVGAECTVAEYTSAVVSSSVTLTADAQAAGFGDPVFRHALDGTPLTGWLPRGRTERTTVPVTVAVRVPTSTNAAATQERTIAVDVEATGPHAVLTFPAGDGEYDVLLTVAAGEGPSGALATEASSRHVVQTLALQLPAQAVLDQTACIARVVDDGRERVRVGRHTLDDVLGDLAERETWKQLGVEEIGVAVASVVHAAQERPGISAKILAAASAELGFSTVQLEDLGAQVLGGP